MYLQLIVLETHICIPVAVFLHVLATGVNDYPV